MVQSYRCKSCGYYHVGPAPEKCPVCGAPQAFFLPYEGPGDLAGSKTLENLKAAFAGESQANRRYTLWSRIAELEGAASAVDAFNTAAAEETAHALGHLAYLGGFGETATNLKAAIEGEGYEFREMYPNFAEEAEAEGHPEIAHFFRAVGGFEDKHHQAYEKALGDVEG
ncbi:MAG: ferritin family protein [Coriobacteriia bacterium]|nr:ferritin family protein [Coriobacteriia bacterium]